MQCCDDNYETVVTRQVDHLLSHPRNAIFPKSKFEVRLGDGVRPSLAPALAPASFKQGLPSGPEEMWPNGADDTWLSGANNTCLNDDDTLPKWRK